MHTRVLPSALAVGALIAAVGGIAIGLTNIADRPQTTPAAAQASVASGTATPVAALPSVTTLRPSSASSDATSNLVLDWQAADLRLPAGVRAGAIVGIVDVQGGYIALVNAAGPTRRIFGWRSADGLTWDLLPRDRDLVGVFGHWVASDGERIAVGVRDATLISADAGRSWKRVKTPSFTSGAAVPGRFFAMTAGPAATAIWTSPDGNTWAHGSLDVTTREASSGITLRTLKSTAVGHRAIAAAIAATEPPRIWVALDDPGLGMQRVELPIDDPYVIMQDVAGSDRGLVAIGWVDYCCGTQVFHSVDGLTWERGPRLRDGRAGASDVVATKDGFLLFGSDGDGDSMRGWASVDGSAWATIPADRLPTAHPTTVHGGRDGSVIMLVADRRAPGQQSRLVVWKGD